ncbi:unnamed protein product, partial [Scytosiphon promiscuus]
ALFCPQVGAAAGLRVGRENCIERGEVGPPRDGAVGPCKRVPVGQRGLCLRRGRRTPGTSPVAPRQRLPLGLQHLCVPPLQGRDTLKSSGGLFPTAVPGKTCSSAAGSVYVDILRW